MKKTRGLYANFYDKKNRCLYSVRIKTKSEGYRRADYEYANNGSVADWTITEKAMGKDIIA